MSKEREGTRRGWRVVRAITVVGVALGIMAGCGQMLMHLRGTGAVRPTEEAFGLGPRASELGLFRASLEPTEPIRPRKLQSLKVVLTDADGRPIDGATITVDGGMPEHGHGLPTQPRVTDNASGGVYVVEGVRFNMGGWWELKLAISTATGTDLVTFNLEL